MPPLTRAPHPISTLRLRRGMVKVTSLLAILSLVLFAPAAAQPLELAQPTAPQATLMVLNTNDSGADSLRQAILTANSGDTIVFTSTLAGQTIVLTGGEIAIGKALTIDGAAAPGVTVSGNDTSRIFNASSGPLTLKNLILQHGTDASSGGAVYAAGDITLTNTSILSSTAGLSGGGLFVAVAAADAYLMGGLFQHNTGSDGGGIYVEMPTTLHMTGTHFLHNEATFNGGGAYISGDAFLQGGLFELNTAGLGGGLYSNWWGALTMSGTQFLDNHAQQIGGGVYAMNTAEVRDSLFQSNSADGPGGGFYAGNTTVVSNTQFIANLSLGDGSGMFNSLAQQTGSPDAVLPGNASRIANSLFARNLGGVRGSIVGFDAPGSLEILYTTVAHPASNTAVAIKVINGSVYITETILTSYTVGISNVNGIVSEDYNLLFGNGTDIQGAVTSGGHDQTGAPNFINPNAGDYHLNINSSAIDHGLNISIANDLDYVTRPQGNGFDIGAYEQIPVTLSANNNSPTVLGSPTSLTATLTGYVLPAPIFTWDFGDGSPTGAGATLAHTYPAIGVYTATVTADNGAMTLTATTIVTVTDQPILNLTATNDSPTVLGSPTHLTATASGSNIVYTWDFGDNSPAAVGATQSHIYPAAGNYTTIVVATNSLSGVEATTNVTITMPPTIRVVYLPLLLKSGVTLPDLIVQSVVDATAFPSLVPNGVLTLTLRYRYYSPDRSYLAGTLPANTVLYVQVDSYNMATNYGAVLETHEYFGLPCNNIFGPTHSTAAYTVSLSSALAPDRTHANDRLPSHP